MTITYRYSDLDFKLRRLSNGDVNMVTDEKAINQSLMSLFSTLKGERLFNLSYGTDLPRMIFEPFERSTATALSEIIKLAVQTYEGNRISLNKLNISLDEKNLTYNIFLEYYIKSTTEIGTMGFTIKT